MASLLNMSGALLRKDMLPYDAEIEWLGGDQTGSKIITNIIADQYTSAKIEFMFADGANLEWPHVIRGDDSPSGATGRWWIPFYSYSYMMSLLYKSYTIISALKYESGVKYVGTYNALNSNKVCTVNGISVSINISSSYTGNTFIYLNTDRVKFYKLKLYDSNGVLFDGIPVRVGNVGYMYDKVSGQLFGNAGTGSFILGPDI